MTGLMTLMDVSTSHLTEAAATYLHHEGLMRSGDLIVYEKGEYGWFLPVIEEMDTPHPSLNIVIAEARARNVEWIMFDSDGEVWPDIPTYDW